MMPFIFGDNSSVPENLHSYIPLIDKCDKLTKGKVAYLTIQESFVTKGSTQRRPGIHTDATKDFGWGGGEWGGKKKGIYIASSDGSCRIWNCMIEGNNVDQYGGLLISPEDDPNYLDPNNLYWLTDRTPHEALSVNEDTNRQFFRLVSDEISIWWKQHSTENPLGVQPNCKVLTHSKFE